MFSFDPAELGERLHALRRRRHQTLRELGTQAEVNYVTLSKIERGKMPQVSADIVGRLADVLEVSVDYLLGRQETPNLIDATPSAKERSTPQQRIANPKAKE
jgi:transcriptional regulator with XRE-family HTH domain